VSSREAVGSWLGHLEAISPDLCLVLSRARAAEALDGFMSRQRSRGFLSRVPSASADRAWPGPQPSPAPR